MGESTQNISLPRHNSRAMETRNKSEAEGSERRTKLVGSAYSEVCPIALGHDQGEESGELKTVTEKAYISEGKIRINIDQGRGTEIFRLDTGADITFIESPE